MSPLFALLWGEASEAAALAARPGEADWLTLNHQAVQHRLRPLLHVRSTAGSWPVPPDLARQWQASYKQLIAQGKPPKVAITALMRKLIVTANALLKADRLWVRYPT
jgi:hypothetical protein